MKPAENRAIFLDRDGTINRDTGYTHKIRDWLWLDGALTGLKIFAQSGWLLVVVSNQSGIGRGFYDMQAVEELQFWLERQLTTNGIAIADWEYCPHLPDAGCFCRKPAPGMLLKAATKLNIDLSRSWMLGDKISDIQAGIAAGCQAGLIGVPAPDTRAQMQAHFPDAPVWPDLTAAALSINSHIRANPTGLRRH